ncbi:hypothetical protein PF008_g8096 [Phytophthora fragariae]|uniref:Uncharacterized protein n=1 Tax=Phytophthora fragariae TaxID=53985 RepID=A0A6G0S159_9STRA|nr:hypothetical protein PF008_g8096 [Phytophthora fragariae]
MAAQGDKLLEMALPCFLMDRKLIKPKVGDLLGDFKVPSSCTGDATISNLGRYIYKTKHTLEARLRGRRRTRGKMGQAADDAPRAVPPFPPVNCVCNTGPYLDARTSALALPHSETPSQPVAHGVVAASARSQDSQRRVGSQKKANTGEASIATKQPSFAWTTAAADALLRSRFDTLMHRFQGARSAKQLAAA